MTSKKCAALYNHTHIRPGGKVYPCCRFKKQLMHFDGNFDRLEATYYKSSVLKFEKKEDGRKIYNLRCFFSLLTHHPWLLRFVKPLLNLPFNKVFWTIGNILDGYYIRKGIAYKQKPKEFITSVIHFLTNYRNTRKLSKDLVN